MPPARSPQPRPERPPLTQRRGDTDCAGKAALLQRAAAEEACGAGGGGRACEGDAPRRAPRAPPLGGSPFLPHSSSPGGGGSDGLGSAPAPFWERERDAFTSRPPSRGTTGRGGGRGPRSSFSQRGGGRCLETSFVRWGNPHPYLGAKPRVLRGRNPDPGRAIVPSLPCASATDRSRDSSGVPVREVFRGPGTPPPHLRLREPTSLGPPPRASFLGPLRTNPTYQHRSKLLFPLTPPPTTGTPSLPLQPPPVRTGEHLSLARGVLRSPACRLDSYSPVTGLYHSSSCQDGGCIPLPPASATIPGLNFYPFSVSYR